MTECQCDNCKRGCSCRPGWFKPEEIDVFCEYMSMSRQEAFDQYLAVDWWNEAEGLDDTFLLAPAIRGYEGGSYPANPRGECVFFEQGLCSIYPVRPFECREYHHSHTFKDVHQRHREVAKSWVGHHGEIVELLGYEPYAERWSLLDDLLRIGTW